MTTDLPAGRELDALVAEKPYRCRKCGGTSFKWRKGGPTGTFRICSPCTLLHRRAHYAANRDHMRAKRRESARRNGHAEKFREYRRKWHIRIRYGLSEADLKRMIEGQGGRCAICSMELVNHGKTGLHVDHCHRTGVVRGLLCAKCNVGIENFRESPAALRAAAAYIERAAIMEAAHVG